IRWYQFDPPKYLIWVLSKLGLASDLKRVDPLMIKKKLVQADRNLLLEHLEQVYDAQKAALMEKVEKTSQKLSESIMSAKAVRDKDHRMRAERRTHEARELKAHFRKLQNEIREDLKTWKILCRTIIKLKPQPQPVPAR